MVVVLSFYFLWSRRHSALIDGGDGLIPTAAPTEDEVLIPPEGIAMTVVVGYLAGKAGRSALHLAVEAAQTLNTSLAVATVVPKPWTTPSPARIDAEYATWADQLGADSQREAQRCPRPDHEWARHQLSQVSPSRTAGEGLLEAAEELGAEVS